MGSNQLERVDNPVSEITGGIYGDNLLSQLKCDMLKQSVFQTMFGDKGQRFFIDSVPSYNETIFPLIELYWSKERFNNGNTIVSGSITGRIILPTTMDSKENVNLQRSVASAIQRFLGSNKHELFKYVLGLTEFGVDSEWTYERLFAFGGSNAPAIDFVLPYKFDLTWLQQQRPDVDLNDDLDADLIGWMEKYIITVTDDNSNVLK